jgi:hypothetical protein
MIFKDFDNCENFSSTRTEQLIFAKSAAAVNEKKHHNKLSVNFMYIKHIQIMINKDILYFGFVSAMNNFFWVFGVAYITQCNVLRYFAI